MLHVRILLLDLARTAQSFARFAESLASAASLIGEVLPGERVAIAILLPFLAPQMPLERQMRLEAPTARSRKNRTVLRKICRVSCVSLASNTRNYENRFATKEPRIARQGGILQLSPVPPNNFPGRPLLWPLDSTTTKTRLGWPREWSPQTTIKTQQLKNKET
jgi:hypothetical protein